MDHEWTTRLDEGHVLSQPLGWFGSRLHPSERFRHSNEPQSRYGQAFWPLGLNSHPAVLVESASTLILGRDIEGFYNCWRRHSSIGYVSPAAFEEQVA